MFRYFDNPINKNIYKVGLFSIDEDALIYIDLSRKDNIYYMKDKFVKELAEKEQELEKYTKTLSDKELEIEEKKQIVQNNALRTLFALQTEDAECIYQTYTKCFVILKQMVPPCEYLPMKHQCML